MRRDGVWVQLFGKRRQRVRIKPTEHGFQLGCVVVNHHMPRSDAEERGRFLVRLWNMNRGMPLVGLRIDGSGHLVAESFIATEGLTEEEFQFHLRNLAREADRLEYLLTGEDGVNEPGPRSRCRPVSRL